MISLLLFGLIGFITWSLCFARSFAWHAQRRGWLMLIVTADEIAGMWIGMYLARSGTWLDAVACAVGGAAAVAVFLRMKRYEVAETTAPRSC